MNENKRLLAFFGIIVLAILVILLISFWPKSSKEFVCGVKADSTYKKLGKVDYEEYQCLVKTKSKNALVVSDNLTKAKKKVLNKTAKSINHVIYYLDTETIESSDLKTVKKKLKYNDYSFEKDVILILKKGKVLSYKEDILGDSDKLVSFAEEAGIAKFACGVTSDKEYENLGEIDYEEYQCLYEKNEPFAVIVAQTTCSYCISFKPIIDEYAKDNNVPVYIMEINEWSDDDRTAFTSSLDYFTDNDSWGTPLTLGIKDKKVVTEVSGYTDDEDTLDNFFDELGLK